MRDSVSSNVRNAAFAEFKRGRVFATKSRAYGEWRCAFGTARFNRMRGRRQQGSIRGSCTSSIGGGRCRSFVRQRGPAEGNGTERMRSRGSQHVNSRHRRVEARPVPVRNEAGKSAERVVRTCSFRGTAWQWCR